MRRVSPVARTCPPTVRGLPATQPHSDSGDVTPLSGDYPGLQAVQLLIPANHEAPEARHNGEEWLYVLDGVIELTIAGDRLALTPGDAVHFPSQTAHRILNTRPSPATVLLVSAPSAH